MRPEVDLDQPTKEAVKAYADKNGLKMPRAYGDLIRRALRTRVGVDFTWGDRDDEFMVIIDNGDITTMPTFGPHIPRDRAYVVNAEHRDAIENSSLEYGEFDRLDNAVQGIHYPTEDSRGADPDAEPEVLDDDNTHARRTLSMLRQADREGVDVSDRVEELEDEVEGEDDGA